jgi:two-component system osmolarity sensor histidine kinase EnvZ
MTLRRWLGDTIARRFALAILLAFAATLSMNAVFVKVAGHWGRPSIIETGLLDSAASAVRIIESQPVATRAAIAAAAATASYRVEWYAGEEPITGTKRLRRTFDEALPKLHALLNDPTRVIIFFSSDSPEISTARFSFDRLRDAKAYFMGIQLIDHSWLIFTVPERQWGIQPEARDALQIFFMIVSSLAVAALTARTMARPVERLAKAARRFGTDPHAPAIAAAGPIELLGTIQSFNAMQAQIGRFVADRTVMLAAISHDLRTPLTRMRLRAELIEDQTQQRNFFRDVDEMQIMVDSALAFFRDDARHEPLTAFDLPELLKSIVDDYGDQGVVLSYLGPDHASFLGRPLALRRVFANLVDNAVKYATPPEITLRFTERGAEITVQDRGQGIPSEALEQVFAPFHRLEQSRSRNTGGVGLGLTSVRSIVVSHGGEVRLFNPADGGLQVVVFLPFHVS